MLMREMREALDAGRFEAFVDSFYADRGWPVPPLTDVNKPENA